MSAAEQYTSELREQLRFNATWTPGVPLRLGLIGEIDDGVFVPTTSLDTFGIKFGEDALDDSGESLSYASAGAVNFTFKAAGETSTALPNLPPTKAGLGINFSKEEATIFRADGLRHASIADEIALRHDVASLVKNALWDRDGAIITSIVHAGSTTALVSRSSGAGLEFEIGADVSAGGIELLTASSELKTVSSREMQLSIVAEPGLTPLFRAKRVRRKWFVGELELRATFTDEFGHVFASDDADDDLFDDDPPIFT